ncbi:MBL fold metallo-hydrolase [Jejudonia soesokkakensis]|uniref:MBL fold metallo-hydrolase n=1 Tax=Jejudonia soesokkakensis TaxID=1323432 RepID=A0ABW2MUK9_9FLAO
MKQIFVSFCIVATLVSCKNETKSTTEATSQVETESVTETPEFSVADVTITPISHATMVLELYDKVIYVDPVGGAAAFEGQPEPDLILITDIHGDHYDLETLKNVNTADTKIIVPQAVAEKMPEFMQAQVALMSNGSNQDVFDFNVAAIPMYNLREEALKFHEKGRGNGYVITINGGKIYISGDTEDIPEMRNLKGIDMAFVCMNLPYTMTVESAADAVLDFQPKYVYPYHYRGTEGLSDVAKFKSLVEAGSDSIQVTQLDWYPDKG